MFLLNHMIYDPREDSFLLQKQIKNYAKGLVLDMGTGSGILAEEAAKYAEKVIAADVNPEVIEYCKKNILILNLLKATYVLTLNMNLIL